jgi:hypothetical protein
MTYFRNRIRQIEITGQAGFLFESIDDRRTFMEAITKVLAANGSVFGMEGRSVSHEQVFSEIFVVVDALIHLIPSTSMTAFWETVTDRLSWKTDAIQASHIQLIADHAVQARMWFLKRAASRRLSVSTELLPKLCAVIAIDKYVEHMYARGWNRYLPTIHNIETPCTTLDADADVDMISAGPSSAVTGVSI